MSTAGDTVLTTGALLGYTTLRVLRPGASDRQSLVATRICMVIVASMLGFTEAMLGCAPFAVGAVNVGGSALRSRRQGRLISRAGGG